MFFDFAAIIDLTDKQIGDVFEGQRIKIGLHRQTDALELLSALRSADGDYHRPAVVPEGRRCPLENVLEGPETLAAIDEVLRLGADAHKKYRRGKNQTVRIEYLLQEHLIVIPDLALARGVAGIALDTGTDPVIGQMNVFSICARRFGTCQRAAQKQVTIALDPRAR